MNLHSEYLSVLKDKQDEIDPGEDLQLSDLLLDFSINKDFHDEQNIPTWPSDLTNLVV
jgi:hypothetical protein